MPLATRALALFVLLASVSGPGRGVRAQPSPARDTAALLPSRVAVVPPPVAQSAPVQPRIVPSPVRAPRPTGPVRGVVWTDDAANPALDLARVRETGFTAVRVTGLPPDAVLRAADSLGLRVFVDLPVDYVLASDLRRRLPELRRDLDTLGARARRFVSLGDVGLARRADTSDPATCAVLGDLARHARARGLRPYYVSAFIETDRCGEAVDLVLLTGRDRSVPEQRLARWRRAHGTPVGLGVVGYWVDAQARGTRAANSPEAQARAFETLFARLDTVAAPVFVYRWRDGAGASDDPLNRPYGLLDASGNARPALSVARGFLTGTLAAFAFDAGEPGRGGVPSLLGLFWLAVLFVGIVYAVEPRVRTLLPRYFRARSFYRDGLRDARDTLSVATFGLMVAAVLATGVAAAALVEVLRPLPSFEALVTLLPGTMARLVAALTARPWLLAIFVALVDALSMALWTLLFFFAARRRYLLSMWQALGFVVWPRWTALPLAVAALVTATLPPLWAPRAALVLAGLLVLAIGWGGLRALLDLKIVARPTLGRFLIAIALHPVTLVVLYLGIRAATLGPRLAFLWRLATQP